MAVAFATALLGALICGAAGACGILAANAILPRLHRFDDAPPAADFPAAALVAGAVVVGAVMGFRSPALDQLVVGAISIAALVAIWDCDAKTGIIPDVFTLPPLGLLIVYALFTHQPMAIVSAVAMFVPFGFLAFISRGRGMGWGDAKLAAFGGALLGLESATIAFVLASLVAGLAAWIVQRSRKATVAMGPYLVAAIAATLPFNF